MAVAVALGSAIVAVEFSSELAIRTQRYRRRTDTNTLTIRKLNRDLAHAERRASEIRRRSLARADLARMLFSPDLRRLQLVAADGANQAAGVIAISESSGNALMQLTGLPPSPEGKTYVLWWQRRGGEFTKGAEFTVGTDGTVSASSALPPDSKSVRRCVVTLESDTAASSPSGPAELKCASVR
ncbi:MAG: anti-sigma factor [Candidatus Binataceae bacterium]